VDVGTIAAWPGGRDTFAKGSPREEASMSPIVKYDAEANAAYIRFSPEKVA